MTKEDLLNSNDYEISEKVPLDKAAAWIMGVLNSTNGESRKAPTAMKKVFVSILIALVFALIGYQLGKSLVGADKSFNAFNANQIVWSLLLFMPLLAIHEVIHALAFKYCGAPKVGFGYSLKSLMVYAYAQDFPINMRQLKWIAIMPFLVITICLLLAVFILAEYKILILGLLFIHTFCCVGDFALVKYALKNPNNITYDDVEKEKMMYFFKPNHSL